MLDTLVCFFLQSISEWVKNKWMTDTKIDVLYLFLLLFLWVSWIILLSSPSIEIFLQFIITHIPWKNHFSLCFMEFVLLYRMNLDILDSIFYFSSVSSCYTISTANYLSYRHSNSLSRCYYLYRSWPLLPLPVIHEYGFVINSLDIVFNTMFFQWK